MTVHTLHLWQVLEDADQDEVLHVVPLVDMRGHVATRACWCNPRRDPHRYGDAYVHNAVTEPQQIH